MLLPGLSAFGPREPERPSRGAADSLRGEGVSPSSVGFIFGVAFSWSRTDFPLSASPFLASLSPDRIPFRRLLSVDPSEVEGRPDNFLLL